MRTHVVFSGEDEIFRGTLPDSCEFIMETFTYDNKWVNLHILIVCPENIDFYSLDEIDRAYMMGKLSYSQRISLLRTFS